MHRFFDYAVAVSLVFGGCCSNAWSLERLLLQSPEIGSALTFSQLLFITLNSLPHFLTFSPPANKHGIRRQSQYVPCLRERAVPLSSWVSQVLVLASASLLNNWAFVFRVPLTVQIVFRSGGLVVSMIFGYFFLRKTYNAMQVASVAFVTLGVILATLSRPFNTMAEPADARTYFIGILLLSCSLLLTGVLGMLQEITYTAYGPHWREGVFYTHLLSLPIFIFLPEVRHGLRVIWVSSTRFGLDAPYMILLLNVFTQLLCVSGVNQLTSKVSSVSTNLVLTTRKAVSLCVSVWWFGSGWNAQLGYGAALVLSGTMTYAIASQSIKEPKQKQE